ncbi:MAG: type VI secretion protein [Roseobacter sp.]|jgi:type IV secretion system protein VirD4|uniref:Protein VirD4 n=2 Tax=Roseobacteraceae TaxID=2854170 RepID=A0AAX3AFP7_9RHOB|nr:MULTISPECIES: type IV secretory system conjugative DNA transfer family protein [Sulfitobacter]MAB17679.1 type VI secretion protein [Roseobacter sp.]HBU53888.1 type VI secretion protein [Sulfitobacter sp.]MBG64111.1 type VI secretion protein [Roseobacter sp.]UOA24565.1 Protein VirD4 [Sulfitobacter pontiacus]WPZ27089.1 type IV secretory system conjugative DNA transfer family protein [Sulfitobacter pontiacus]|tara:strand:- start:1787 stop:3778 length:1992 start_codon:yes stop_codon:yes gene_type:complete
MGKAWIAIGVVLVTLVAGAMGYTIASAVLTFKALGFSADIDFGYIAQNYLWIRDRRPDDFQLINLIIGGAAVAGLMMSLALSGSALTRFGQTHWQKRGEMKTNGFFGKPGTGFILGKLGSPKSRARYITSKVFPHALIVAPTGRGKTSGFVIPNLLTWQGSAVTLDVKGECFEATARHRAAQGDKVYRFAPTDWVGKRTHRYNPLLRIYELEDPARQQMELQLLATLFLQSDNDRVQGLLKGGIDLFVAAGLLAFQRKKPNLGEIYRIAASGGNKQKEYVARGHEIDNKAAKLIFTRLASTNNDTLTSYVSLLMTSGLDQWQNPAIDEATQISDFDFRTIRKKPFTVYLVVQPLMVKPLAPLIRLFFSDLLSAMQEKEPGKDEPWPVMIMLDEFNRLGKMPIVVESIETLRTYRGHLAVVTQTIPALDEIYGENTRRALQGNAGVKLYLTPSDEKTIEELSKAVGKTTKTVITRSRSIGKNPFEGRSQSTRTEETSLLPEDEARRLPLDEIIMVVDAQMPVRAKRIQYFDDRLFAAIHGAQRGELPFPVMGGGGGKADGSDFGGTERSPSQAGTSAEPQVHDERLDGPNEVGSGKSVPPAKKSSKTVQAVVEEEQRQMEMSFADQVEMQIEEIDGGGIDRLDTVVDDLDGLESRLKQGEGVSG